MNIKRTILGGLLISALVTITGCFGENSPIGNTPDGRFFGITNGNRLVRFDTTTLELERSGTITGLEAGETIQGLDFRPANSQLYALGSGDNIYVINILTYVATRVGTGLGSATTGSTFGFDFNPSVDRIRITSDTGENLRAHPDTGVLAGTDTALTPAGTLFSAVAYTPAGMGGPTTLFSIDAIADQLNLQGGPDGNPSPNGGVNTQVGPLNVDFSGSVGFDIGSDGTAYAVDANGAGSSIYTINLTTGAATLIGQVGDDAGGNPISISSLAIQPIQ